MEQERDLEADLKILTTIPPDPSEVNMISDIVAPHALRRAIAAEKANRLLIEAIQKAIVDLENLKKYEIASFAHPQLPMVNDMIDDLRKAIKEDPIGNIVASKLGQR